MQDEFLSQKHKRLLTIATWANVLAWVVLIVYIFSTFGYYIQVQTDAYYNVQARDFLKFLSDNELYAVSIFIQLLGIILKGVVYFLTLKGISLGLNMIVETDINYRELKDGNNEQ